MSQENVDQGLLNIAPGTPDKAQKQSKIFYTREFLLSLCGLDVCKNLPSGFDKAILSEFDDVSLGLQDRQRIQGNVPQQGFRRSEYGTSPPSRGDSGNYSRGPYGRWESRSSNWNDKEIDSQSEKDSDFGKRYAPPSHRPWQNTDNEHDGLLGSGSFPRPGGSTPGISTSKAWSNDHYQLNKSNAPYHPPRPYKAVPHVRKDIKDLYNDETFGSAECTNEDRMEEERRRRASFELMRKERHQGLHEKQKLNLDKANDESVTDTNVLPEESKEKKLFDRNNELNAITTQPLTNIDSGRHFLSQSSVSRPHVPPGFISTSFEKKSGTTSLFQSDQVEVHGKGNPAQNGILENQEEQQSADGVSLGEQHASESKKKSEDMGSSLSRLEASGKETGLDDDCHGTCSSSIVPQALNDNTFELAPHTVDKYKSIGKSNEGSSTSILDKLFGSAENLAGSRTSCFVKYHDGQLDEVLSSNVMNSSKFAQWFVEEEKKPAGDPSSRANDLLSLIFHVEKAGIQVSDEKTDKDTSPDILFSENTKSLVSLSISSETKASEELYLPKDQDVTPAILTCEDLEQTILSEFSESSSTLQPSDQEWSVSGIGVEQSRGNVDDRASQQLLLLLQKGMELREMAPSSEVNNMGFSNQLQISGEDNMEVISEKPSGVDGGSTNTLEKSLTLETLFGTAFMKELHSVEAPVSVQRNTVESSGLENFGANLLSFQDKNGDNAEMKSSRKGYGISVLAGKETHHTESGENDNLLEFNGPQIQRDSSNFKRDVTYRLGGFDGTVDIQLPEEESLITVGDPVKPLISSLYPGVNSVNNEFVVSTSVSMVDNLAALNMAFKDDHSIAGQEGASFIDRYKMESRIPFRDLHGQTSLTQFSPQSVSHGRPLFGPVDPYSTHIGSRMYMEPDNIIHHDGPSNHQYAAHMLRPPFHHHTAGMTGYDTPNHPLLRQMQVTNDLPLAHPHHEVPRGTRMVPYAGSQVANFMQEVNPMERFPFDNRQPNINARGMSLPVAEVSGRGNHPESFQRLEMELRTNSKQTHPPFAVDNSRGLYGNELDMGFRY